MDVKLIITKSSDQTSEYPFKVRKRMLIFDTNHTLLKIHLFFAHEYDAAINEISQNGFKILAIREIDTDHFDYLEMDDI